MRSGSTVGEDALVISMVNLADGGRSEDTCSPLHWTGGQVIRPSPLSLGKLESTRCAVSDKPRAEIGCPHGLMKHRGRRA